MRAMVCNRFGGPDVLEPAEIDKPRATPGHVVIRVAATSVNPVDFKIRQGARPAVAPPFPAVLHGDVAGVVDEVGAGVDQFAVGDEVFGCAGGFRGLGGALAEYMLADATLLARKPSRLSMREAAALPLVCLTAWEGLFDRAKVNAGQRVLVHAGAGGVGHVALQLAKSAGAHVCTTVSGDAKAAIARDLGADEVINYRTESVADYVKRCTDGAGFDVVFDTVGGQSLDWSLQAARPNGTVISISTQASHDLTPMHQKGLSLHVVFMLLPLVTGKGRDHHGAMMREVARLADEGKLRPLVDPHEFTLEQAGQAHALLESGQAVGKVVISV